MVKAAGLALRDRLEGAALESVTTAIKELAAEVMCLEAQIDQDHVKSLLETLDQVIEGQNPMPDLHELETLLQSFGLSPTASPLQRHMRDPSVDRSSFTRSSISTPLFHEAFEEREEQLTRSHKKTQGDLQMIDYETGSKGMFWIEDSLPPKDRFFLEKVATS